MQRPDSQLYSKLRSIAHPFLPHLLGVLMLELLSTPLTLLAPIPLQIAVDSVVHLKPVPSAFRWILGNPVGKPQSLLLGVCMLSLGIVLVGQVHMLVE